MHYYVQKGISLDDLKKATLVDKKFYMASFLKAIEDADKKGGGEEWETEQ